MYIHVVVHVHPPLGPAYLSASDPWRNQQVCSAALLPKNYLLLSPVLLLKLPTVATSVQVTGSVDRYTAFMCVMWSSLVGFIFMHSSIIMHAPGWCQEFALQCFPLIWVRKGLVSP